MPPSTTAPQSAGGFRPRVASQLRRFASQLDGQPPNTPAVGQPMPFAAMALRFTKKLFRRLLIWLLSLSVAFYVPLTAAGFPFDIQSWENEIGTKHKFSDVFLATVAMVVLSASDLIDNIIAGGQSKRTDWITTGSAWMMIAVYFLFIFYGMPIFAAFENGAQPTSTPYGLFFVLLLVGIFGELMIAAIPD